jgi:histidinol-phosphate aminotransferase
MSTHANRFLHLSAPGLPGLQPYIPGKPLSELERELGITNSIKLASNENPLGPGARAREAAIAALAELGRYPDGGGFELRRLLAERHGVEMAAITLGNGSNDVLDLIARVFLHPGQESVFSQHAFAVYAISTQAVGATARVAPARDFGHDLDAMAALVNERTRVVWIANPNNPTGTLVTQEQIDRFMDKVPEHVVVVFDEAYYEFLNNPPDTLKYVRQGRNVVVLRTFSKIQGLAGTRVGYGIANKELIDILQRTRQPFNINSIAQAGALAGLLDQEHQDLTKKITDEGRDYLQQQFADMGLEYIPSYANFVLVKVGDGNAVFKAMMNQGVIVRAMAAYKLPEWVRISVGTMAQNQRCIEVLKQVLAA